MPPCHTVRSAVSRLGICQELIAELATPWDVRCDMAAQAAARKRKTGARPQYELVFTDRVLVRLVHLRSLLSLSVRTTSSAWRSGSMDITSPGAWSGVTG